MLSKSKLQASKDLVEKLRPENYKFYKRLSIVKGPKTNLKVAMVNKHKSWLEKDHAQRPGPFFKSSPFIIRSNERDGCRKEHQNV